MEMTAALMILAGNNSVSLHDPSSSLHHHYHGHQSSALLAPISVRNETAPVGYLESRPQLQAVFATILTLVAVIGLFGNILIIVTVGMIKSLRIASNLFIVNLALADLVVTTVVDPFNVVGAFVGAPYFIANYTLCEIIASLCAPACLCSMFSICAIAINRYVMICQYHLYERVFTWKNTVVMCLALWGLAYLLHLPNHVGWGSNDFDPVYYICTFSIATHSYAVFYICVGVFVPLVVVFISYANVFRHYWLVKSGLRKRKHNLEIHYSAKRQKDKHSQQQHKALLEVPSGNSPSIRDPEAEYSGNALVDPPSAEISFRKARQRGFTSDDIKLAKTLFTVFIAFLICWFPFAVFVLMAQPDHIPGWMYMIAIIMAHGNSSINCILYGLTNDRFRQGYKTVLGIDCIYRTQKCPPTYNGASLRPSHSRDLDSCRKKPYVHPLSASYERSCQGEESNTDYHLPVDQLETNGHNNGRQHVV